MRYLDKRKRGMEIEQRRHQNNCSVNCSENRTLKKKTKDAK
jgi:hypothetical protein